MNSRLKLLRKTLGLTQAQMGMKLAIKQNSYSVLENSDKIDEKNIALICATLGVNEEWLRDGVGEMFVVTQKSIVDEFCETYHATEMERAALEAYFELPENYRTAAMEILKQLAAKTFEITNGKVEVFRAANTTDGDASPAYVLKDEEQLNKIFNAPDSPKKL